MRSFRPAAGQVVTIDLEVGDNVSAGQTLATVRDSATMSLTVYFLADEAKSFSDMGTNTPTVSVQCCGATRSLSVDDMYGIVEDDSAYFALRFSTASMAGTVKIGSESSSYTMVTGVSGDYLEIKGYALSEGRGLQYSDIAQRKKVCVIGAYLNMASFGGNALGETLRVGGQSLTVVGVAEQQSDTLEGGGTDDFLNRRYSTASRISGAISSYVITVVDEDNVDECVTVLENALYDIFESDDFYTVISVAFFPLWLTLW